MFQSVNPGANTFSPTDRNWLTADITSKASSLKFSDLQPRQKPRHPFKALAQNIPFKGITNAHMPLHAQR